MITNVLPRFLTNHSIEKRQYFVDKIIVLHICKIRQCPIYRCGALFDASVWRTRLAMLVYGCPAEYCGNARPLNLLGQAV